MVLEAVGSGQLEFQFSSIVLFALDNRLVDG